MQIKVAIVENEIRFIKQLREGLEEWSTDNFDRCELCIDQYTEAESLLKSAKLDYDIIFMDIQLDGDMNGVDAAKNLREVKYQNEIVFLTSYREYVFDGYDVRALNYLLKPVSYEKIKQCLDIVLNRITGGYYIYRSKDKKIGKDEIIKIPYTQILYFLSSLHYVEVFTAERSYRQMDVFKSLLQRLPVQFRLSHRTVIVNIEHVVKLQYRDILMSNGKVLPVSYGHIGEIRKAFMNGVAE